MNKNILIVDDEKIIRTVLERILNKSGFNTQIANNGKDALLKIKKDPYDLILLDILMPEMNGIQFLTELKKINNTSKILIISACHEQTLIEQIKKLGVHGYLKKPFDNIDQITVAINKVLA